MGLTKFFTVRIDDFMNQRVKRPALTPELSLVIALALLAAFPNQAITSERFTIVAATASLVLGYVVIRDRVSHVPVVARLVVGMTLPIVISTIYLVPAEFPALVRTTILMVLVALVGSRIAADRRSFVYSGLYVIALVESLTALSQKLAGSPLLWGHLGSTAGGLPPAGNVLWGPAGRAFGSMGHPIPLGLVAAAGLLLVLFGRLPVPSWVRVTSGLVFVAALMSSGSRSAVIVVVTASFVSVLVSRSMNRLVKFFLVAFALLAAVLVSWSSLAIFTSLQGDVSLTHRQGSWSVLLSLLDSGPFVFLFGAGWNSLESLSEAGILGGATGILAIDNGFVAQIALGGVLSLAILLVLLGRMTRLDPAGFSIALLSAGMLMSFDIYLWAFPSALLIGILAMGDEASPQARSGDSSSMQARQAVITVRP